MKVADPILHAIPIGFTKSICRTGPWRVDHLMPLMALMLHSNVCPCESAPFLSFFNRSGIKRWMALVKCSVPLYLPLLKSAISYLGFSPGPCSSCWCVVIWPCVHGGPSSLTCMPERKLGVIFEGLRIMRMYVDWQNIRVFWGSWRSP